MVLLPLLLLACRSTSEPVSTPEPRPTTPAPVPVTTPVPTPVPTTTPTPTGDGTLSSLDVGTPLTPPFDPELRYYWVRAADLGTEVVVDAEGDGDVEEPARRQACPEVSHAGDDDLDDGQAGVGIGERRGRIAEGRAELTDERAGDAGSPGRRLP